MKTKGTVLLAAVILLASCGGHADSEYDNPLMWCSVPQACVDSVDVFYIVSTGVIESVSEDGHVSPLALLSDEEKAVLSREINFIHRELFPDSLNFFAPYYHQVTMKALLDSGSEDQAALFGRAETEICESFDYYMANMNDGRPFVLAGFSQGAIMVGKLLNHMTDDQYSRMVAAYMIGFGLDSATLSCPRVKPASGPYDKGVTISYNSARDTSSVWPVVYNNACACINPVNWTVDSTPADFDYDGDVLTATMDTVRNIIVVDGYDQVKYELHDWDGAPWPRGNYHHFDMLFYNSFIRRNVMDRISH